MNDAMWVMRIEPAPMTLGRALKQARAKAGLSQKQVERQGGFTQTSLSQWERDAALPKQRTLQKLADFYGVDAEPLIALLREAMLRRELEAEERALDLDATPEGVPGPALAIPERPGVREALEALNAIDPTQMRLVTEHLRMVAKGAPKPVKADEEAG